MGRDATDNSQPAPEQSSGHFSFSDIMGKAKELGGKAMTAVESGATKAGHAIQKEVNDPHNRAVVENAAKKGTAIAVGGFNDSQLGKAVKSRDPGKIAEVGAAAVLTGGTSVIVDVGSHAAGRGIDQLPEGARSKVKPAADIAIKSGITSIPTNPAELVHQAIRNPELVRGVVGAVSGSGRQGESTHQPGDGRNGHGQQTEARQQDKGVAQTATEYVMKNGIPTSPTDILHRAMRDPKGTAEVVGAVSKHVQSEQQRPQERVEKPVATSGSAQEAYPQRAVERKPQQSSTPEAFGHLHLFDSGKK